MIIELQNRFPGISYVYRDREGKFGCEYVGVADCENGFRVDENTIFPACSISKFVTALCVMKLAETGMVNIDEDVNQYLKLWKVRNERGLERKVTLRQLLSHTAGIVDGDDAFYGHRLNDKRIDLKDILEGRTSYNARPARVVYEPGSEFEYSDAGFCIIQMLLEEVSRKPFDILVKELIFLPLDFENSFFGTPENIRHYSEKKALATGYLNDGEPIEDAYPICPDLAASALWSTSKELFILAEDFISSFNGKGHVLKKESTEEMLKSPDEFPWVGLGIFKDGDCILSKGWGENGQCMMKICLQNRSIGVVMTNQDPGVPQEESGIEKLIDLKI